MRGLAGGAAVERFVLERNIRSFERKLRDGGHPRDEAVIRLLLADARAQLTRLDASEHTAAVTPHPTE